MSKIEIHDIKQLIDQNYPLEIIQKLIQDVLLLSMTVKQDYPDYRSWFLNTQIPGLYDNTRNIIIAHINDKIVGFVSLKKTSTEKKICTFYVEKSFRRNKIGTILVEKAIDYLEESRPLITIPMNKLNEFIKIGNYYNWEITDIKENLYRTSTPEVIVNGTIEEKNGILLPSTSIEKVYKLYLITRIKQSILTIISIPQKLWKQ